MGALCILLGDHLGMGLSPLKGIFCNDKDGPKVRRSQMSPQKEWEMHCDSVELAGLLLGRNSKTSAGRFVI